MGSLQPPEGRARGGFLGKIPAPLDNELRTLERGGAKWKAFLLSDIFHMVNTKSITQSDIVPNSGNTPYVTASASNNGVMTTIACHHSWLEKGNCIMIGGKTLTFTYQEKDFCSNDSHNIALYLKDERYATRIHYLFFIAALRAALRHRYSWGNSISMQRIKHESIYLPMKNNHIDFDFMERFITVLEAGRIAKLNTYLSSSGLDKYELTEEEYKIIHGGGKHLFFNERILLLRDLRPYPAGTPSQKRRSTPRRSSFCHVRHKQYRRSELRLERCRILS